MRKEFYRLPLPHLQSVLRKRHRNAESVVATDSHPVELVTVSAEEAPVYLSVDSHSQPETYRIWDNRTWRAVSVRRKPVAIADFGRAILQELSENLASLQGATLLKARSRCPRRALGSDIAGPAASWEDVRHGKSSSLTASRAIRLWPKQLNLLAGSSA